MDEPEKSQKVLLAAEHALTAVFLAIDFCSMKSNKLENALEQRIFLLALVKLLQTRLAEHDAEMLTIGGRKSFEEVGKVTEFITGEFDKMVAKRNRNVMMKVREDCDEEV